MSGDEGGRGSRRGGGSVDPRSKPGDRGTAPAVGRRTLVEQARPGAPPVQRRLDRDDGQARGAVPPGQVMPRRESEASAPRAIAAPISLVDLFGPPRVADPGRQVVQRKAGDVTDDAARDGAAVAEIAGRGVSGPGSPLPYRYRIQASFGRHDVSGARAHHGAAAAVATHELGAKAYTFGNAVAFAGSPDLHTAAHEAAHVVQQRRGVQLKGGIDQPGDEYERHADAVADAVVAGQSAEPLLDQVAGAASSVGVAVQRKSDGGAPASPAKQRRTMEIYLAANQRNVWALAGEHMRSVSFPDPTERLSWTNQRRFARELLMQLEANISDFTPLAKLDEILYPSDATRVVGALLPSTDAWSPPIGLAIAQAMQIAVVSSLRRLGSRYLAVADSGAVGDWVMPPGALVYSMPIDRYVGAAMCTPRTLTIEPPNSKSAGNGGSKRTGLRPTKLAWEGARDPQLWNWVRATEPSDATTEEVAAALWTVIDHHGETNAAFNAYLLAAAPPLFGIPKKFAIQNPNARQFAPANALRGEGGVDAELADVAASSASDAIALHQAPAAAAPSKTKLLPSEPSLDRDLVLAMLEDCQLQLAFVTSEVAAWGLADQTKPAIGFVMRKQSELALGDAGTLSGWARVFSGQRDRVFKIAGAIHKLVSNAARLGVTDPKAAEAGPLLEILELLATAAGTSQFAQTSEAKLQQALELQAGLNVRAVQASERDLQSAHLDFSATMGPRNAKSIAGFSHEVVGLQEKSRELQTTMINGGEVDTAELDEVTLRSGEIALRERMLGTIHSTFELQEAAMSAKDGIAAHIAMLFSGRFRNLEGLCQHVRDRVVPIQDEMIATERRIHDEERSHAGTRDQKAKHRAARRAVLAKAQSAFATLSLDEDLRNFFREGAKVVQNQHFRTTCVKAAALIGIAVLASAAAGFVAELAGGMLMGAEGVATVAELSTLARIGVTTANVIADSAFNAVGQSAVQGGSLKQAFVENLFMSFASTALFGTITRAAAETAKLEGREAMTWARAESFAQKAFVAGKETGAITVHTIWGAAIGYVAHRVVSRHEPSPMEARDWLLQGASVAIGRHVHKALGARMPGLERLAKRSAEVRQLILETKQLQQLAGAVEQSKNAASAVELLDRRTKLLHEENEAIETITARGGDISGELGKAHKDLEDQIRESNTQAMLETKFHLLGLEELVPGALWKGSQEQIVAALESAKRTGVTIAAKPPQGDSHTWHIDFDGRPVEIVERRVRSTSTVVSGGPPQDGTRGPKRATVRGLTTSQDVGSGIPDREVARHEQDTEKIAKPEKFRIRSLTLAGPGDEFAEAAKMVLPDPGTTDVVVHGSPSAFLVFHNGTWVSLTPNSLRAWLRKQGYKGGPIRLLSCESGAHDGAIAQSIANGLGVDVKAPSDAIWVHENGVTTIGPTSRLNSGKWITFHPRKNKARPVDVMSTPLGTEASESGISGQPPDTAVSGGRQDRRGRENRLKDKSRQLRKNHDAEDSNSIPDLPAIDEIRTVPVGMKLEQFQRFGDALHRGLAELGAHDVVAVVQGSGVSNRRHRDGTSFDEGHVSDYDIALVSPMLLKRAAEFHIKLRGPLTVFELDLLGLTTVRDQLSAMSERPVNFLLVRNTDTPVGIVVP